MGIYNPEHESIRTITERAKSNKIHYGNKDDLCFADDNYFYLENEKARVKTLILFPSIGKKIWQIVSKANSAIQPHFVNSMEEAIEVAYQTTAKDQACLLASGCPSIGIFKDYKDRGDAFIRGVVRVK